MNIRSLITINNNNNVTRSVLARALINDDNNTHVYIKRTI